MTFTREQENKLGDLLLDWQVDCYDCPLCGNPDHMHCEPNCPLDKVMNRLWYGTQEATK